MPVQPLLLKGSILLRRGIRSQLQSSCQGNLAQKPALAYVFHHHLIQVLYCTLNSCRAAQVCSLKQYFRGSVLLAIVHSNQLSLHLSTLRYACSAAPQPTPLAVDLLNLLNLHIVDVSNAS